MCRKMSIELKNLNVRIFVKNAAKMYDLLDINRARLFPWFWWANEKVTPNKLRFFLFMTAYIADTKRKKIAHKLSPEKLYDEQFFIFNENGNIGGMVGLDNIDTQNKKDAEIWCLTFRGNPFGIADSAIQWVEEYSINTGLNSLYAKIQSTNDKSIKLIERNNYEIQYFQKCVPVSKRNLELADMYTYVKQLSK